MALRRHDMSAAARNHAKVRGEAMVRVSVAPSHATAPRVDVGQLSAPNVMLEIGFCQLGMSEAAWLARRSLEEKTTKIM